MPKKLPKKQSRKPAAKSGEQKAPVLPPDAAAFGEKIRAAAQAGNYRSALSLKLRFLSLLKDYYLAVAQFEIAESWPGNEKPPLSLRLLVAAMGANSQIEQQTDYRHRSAVYAISRICLALGNAIAELEATPPQEIGRASKLLMLGSDLGAAYGLKDFQQRIDDAWDAKERKTWKEGTHTGGKRSGEARRQQAADGWHRHALELAIEARRAAPTLSQDGVVLEIQAGWKLQKPGAPGHRTLKVFVSQNEKGGIIPPRSVQ